MNIKICKLSQLSVLLLAVCLLSLGQQVTKTGTTAAKFLSIPVGARAVAVGGAFVALANDATAMYWNPAGMSGLVQSEVVLNHSSWLADINFDYVGVVIPVQDFGTMGINITSLTMGEMERTTEDQPEGTGQMFSAGSFAVGVAYAKNLTEWFSIGANVKYLNENIWNSKATGFAVDIGTLFTTPFSGLKFGAGVSNFGEKMKIIGDDLLVQKDISPNNGNNPNVNANISTEEFDLPLNLRIGFAYEPFVSEDQQLTILLDASHPNDNTESINVGGEYSIFQKMVSIRGGYRGIGLADGEEEFTVGGGFVYNAGGILYIKIDYAYEKFGRLSNVHNFAIGIMF